MGTGNWKLETGERGFTLFELIVAIIIISLLAGAALERLFFYQELAEKAAMESTLRVVKTGLQVRLAELILARREAEAPQLETENPTRWLAEKPVNYAGEYREPPEQGNWYFDARRRELVYAANRGNSLKTRVISGAKQLRFRVKLLTDRIDAPGGPVEAVSGITLVPVYPYLWS